MPRRLEPHANVAVRRRVTMRQVAMEAGVSVATASRAMAGMPGVDPLLVARVREMATKLDYHPNPTARSLARGTTELIGILVPSLANPYFNDILHAITVAASRAGYRVIVADSDESPSVEVPLASSLLRAVDGLILCSPRMATESVIDIARLGRPLVAINRPVRAPNLPTVSVDAYGGAEQICSHLLSLGHRSVVYISGPAASWQNAQRLRALRKLRLSGVDLTILKGDSSIESGWGIADEALATGATAIVGFNDLVCLGLLDRFRERGIGVPTDVSVAGFDNLIYTNYVHPRLTTVDSPYGHLGVLAWQLLSRAMLQMPPHRGPIRLPSHLVIGSSTGPSANASVRRRSHV